jgi:hypothetical protein
VYTFLLRTDTCSDSALTLLLATTLALLFRIEKVRKGKERGVWKTPKKF